MPDTFPPSVVSIQRASANPTAKANVKFTVAFSEPVSGVGIDDFTLIVTDVTGASITAITPASGDAYTVTVVTGSGNGSIRLDVVDDDSILDLAGNPLGDTGTGNGNFTNGDVYSVDKDISSISIGSQDGWILESSETSGMGSTLNTTATVLYVGDNAQDKQYRSFLSFNTAGLPDDAEVTSVKLKIKVQGFVGDNMFTPTKTHGNLLMDVRNPYFGTNANLVVSDFQKGASMNGAGVLTSAPTTG